MARAFLLNLPIFFISGKRILYGLVKNTKLYYVYKFWTHKFFSFYNLSLGLFLQYS